MVLDLFAGTGSLGIEALSRGAARAIFVEKHPVAQKAITQNIQRAGFVHNTSLLRMPVNRAVVFLARQQMNFDLIFADPPYAENIINNTIDDIIKHNILKPGGWLVFEHSSHAEIQDAISKFSCQVKKTQGETEVSFFQNG
jgi:16S rRNA (guanine(966)-N(2))-methyltransferase RsmD